MPRRRALALLCALAGCQADPSGPACRLALVTSVPIEEHAAHLWIPVTLNGHDEAVMLDTGSQVNVLTPETAARVRSKTDVAGGFAQGRLEGIGGARSSYDASISHLGIGAIKANDAPFVVAVGMHDVDMLGMSLFEKSDLDIDLQTGRLTLYLETRHCGQPVTTLTGNVYLVPRIDTANDDRLFVPVTIAGRTLTAQLDTGAPHTALLASGAARLDLQSADGDTALRMNGVGPTIARGYRRIAAPIEIGDLTVHNLPIDVLPDARGEGADMLLGLDFVRKVHVWISQSSHSLVLQFPPLPSPAPTAH